MKNFSTRILILLLLVASPFVMVAQEGEKTQPDTGRFNLGPNMEVLVITHNTTSDSTTQGESKEEQNEEKEQEDDPRRGMGLGFLNVGLANFTSASGNFNLSSDYSDYSLNSSWRTQINLMNDDMHIIKNKLVLFSSIGIENVAYNFSNHQTIAPNTSSISFLEGPAGISFKRNQLNVNYVNVSSMLEACVKKRFHFGFGAMIGYNFTNLYKVKYQDGGIKFKSKIRDDYNVSPIKAELIAKVGYKSLNLFATYAPPAFNQLGEVFSRESGARAIHPYSIGIMLIGKDPESDLAKN